MWGTLADLAVARQLEDTASSNIPKASQPTSAPRSDTITDTSVERACQHGIGLVLSAATNNRDTESSNSSNQMTEKVSSKDTDVEKVCQERLRLLSAAATDYQVDDEAKSASSGTTVPGSKLVSRVRGIPSWKRFHNREGNDSKDLLKRKFKPSNAYLQRRSLPTTRKRKALTWTKPELNETKTPRVASDSPVPSEAPSQALSEAPNDRSRAALETWYKRLNDLYQYKKMYGDCTFHICYKKYCFFLHYLCRLLTRYFLLFFTGNVPQKYELDPPL